MTKLDLKGLKYTMPIVKLARAMMGKSQGDVFEVEADYPGIDTEFEKWCTTTGNTFKGSSQSDGVYTITIVKHRAAG